MVAQGSLCKRCLQWSECPPPSPTLSFSMILRLFSFASYPQVSGKVGDCDDTCVCCWSLPCLCWSGGGATAEVGTSQQIKQRHGSCHELCLSLKPEAEQDLAAGRVAMLVEQQIRCHGIEHALVLHLQQLAGATSPPRCVLHHFFRHCAGRPPRYHSIARFRDCIARWVAIRMSCQGLAGWQGACGLTTGLHARSSMRSAGIVHWRAPVWVGETGAIWGAGQLPRLRVVLGNEHR